MADEGRHEEIELSPLLEKLAAEYAEDPTSKKFRTLAEEYRKSKMYEEAIYICKEGLKYHPKFAPGMITLARCYHERKENEDALLALLPLIDEQPDNVPALRLLAEVYHSLGDIDKAKETYGSVLDISPEDEAAKVGLERINNAYGIVPDEIEGAEYHDVEPIDPFAKKEKPAEPEPDEADQVDLDLDDEDAADMDSLDLSIPEAEEDEVEAIEIFREDAGEEDTIITEDGRVKKFDDDPLELTKEDKLRAGIVDEEIDVFEVDSDAEAIGDESEDDVADEFVRAPAVDLDDQVRPSDGLSEADAEEIEQVDEEVTESSESSEEPSHEAMAKTEAAAAPKTHNEDLHEPDAESEAAEAPKTHDEDLHEPDAESEAAEAPDEHLQELKAESEVVEIPDEQTPEPEGEFAAAEVPREQPEEPMAESVETAVPAYEFDAESEDISSLEDTVAEFDQGDAADPEATIRREAADVAELQLDSIEEELVNVQADSDALEETIGVQNVSVGKPVEPSEELAAVVSPLADEAIEAQALAEGEPESPQEIEDDLSPAIAEEVPSEPETAASDTSQASEEEELPAFLESEIETDKEAVAFESISDAPSSGEGEEAIADEPSLEAGTVANESTDGEDDFPLSDLAAENSEVPKSEEIDEHPAGTPVFIETEHPSEEDVEAKSHEQFAAALDEPIEETLVEAEAVEAPALDEPIEETLAEEDAIEAPTLDEPIEETLVEAEAVEVPTLDEPIEESFAEAEPVEAPILDEPIEEPMAEADEELFAETNPPYIPVEEQEPEEFLGAESETDEADVVEAVSAGESETPPIEEDAESASLLEVDEDEPSEFALDDLLLEQVAIDDYEPVEKIEDLNLIKEESPATEEVKASTEVEVVDLDELGIEEVDGLDETELELGLDAVITQGKPPVMQEMEQPVPEPDEVLDEPPVLDVVTSPEGERDMLLAEEQPDEDFAAALERDEPDEAAVILAPDEAMTEEPADEYVFDHSDTPGEEMSVSLSEDSGEEDAVPVTLSSARIYEAQGHLEKALNIYRKLLGDDPDNTHLAAKVTELAMVETAEIAVGEEDTKAMLERWLGNIDAYRNSLGEE